MTLPALRPSRIPMLYDFPDYIRDPLAFWLSVGRTAPLLRVRLTSLREFWVATDPEFLQHILQTKPKTYVRERLTMRVHRSGRLPYSFNTEDWEEWLWRRRLMQPAFHKDELARFCQVMVEETTHHLEQWSGTIDLERMMKTLTMRIIGRTMFSFEFSDEMDSLQKAYDIWGKYIFVWASLGLNLPISMPFPLNIRTRRAIQKREMILRDIIMKRYQTQQPQNDLLDMLLSAKLESGQSFTAEQLVQELDGIVFAGHDTTAMTLTWIFYHLSQSPTIEAKVLAEIEQVLGGRLPTLDDIDKMPYTNMLIQEALRFYPPVYVTVRENLEADTWGDYALPPHTAILVNIYGVHRLAEYWPHPDEFNPDNFCNPPHRFTFIPFISGPRKCMGDSFAMMEMRLLIPTILQHVRLRFVGEQAVKPKPEFIMHPAERIPMMVERKN